MFDARFGQMYDQTVLQHNHGQNYMSELFILKMKLESHLENILPFHGPRAGKQYGSVISKRWKPCYIIYHTLSGPRCSKLTMSLVNLLLNL